MDVAYNEIDPYCCEWLGNLGAAGHIRPGAVDARSIAEVQPDDVRDLDRFHTFAGVGLWDLALDMAGWPDGHVAWTGSCPCQPFSSAGRRRGTADERHLWPAWFRLIRECRPATIFGEQVSGPAGVDWLGAVFADLETLGYACGAADLCAASVGAPHKRQRLYWVAYAADERREGLPVLLRAEAAGPSGRAGAVPEAAWGGSTLRADRTGTRRPVEPGTFPLADGHSGRVEQLHAYGNAIVPQVAAEFVAAFLETSCPTCSEGE